MYMEKQILKLTGNSKNYYDNLLYFFNTLKNTGFIKNFSECGFFCELSQKKNIFPIYDFFLKNEVYPEMFYFNKDDLSFFHTQASFPMISTRINLVYVPEDTDCQLSEFYPELIDNLQGLVILTGMNSTSDVFKSLHTWSIILQDDRIISI